MSNSPAETMATAVRQALSSHGPMTEDELLQALAVDGFDLGTEAGNRLYEILDEGAEVVVSLADGRLVWLPGLLEGRIFTHRVGELEVEHDMLDIGPDLAPVAVLTESVTHQTLTDGSPIADVTPWHNTEMLAERGIHPSDIENDEAWLLRPGSFTALGVTAGDLIGVRVTAAGFDLTAVDSVETSNVGAAMAGMLDDRSDRPEMLMGAVWLFCDQHYGSFREPVAPLGELLTASDLALDGEWVARGDFNFDVWRSSLKVRSIMARHDLHADEAMAVLTAIHLYDQFRNWAEMVFDTSDGKIWADDGAALPHLLQRARAATTDTHFEGGPNLMDARDALAFFEEPIVVTAFLSETDSHDTMSTITLMLFANSIEKSTPRAARPAMLWLKGRAHEQVGEIELAEQAFREAEKVNPHWPLAIRSLARLASDRGDAERGLSLLRRVGAPPEDPLVQLLEAMQPPPHPIVGRNEPCWCGSGRKFKQCHLNNLPLPLDERAAWLYRKAGGDLLEGQFAPLMIAAAQERSQYWSPSDGLTRGVEDDLVCDVVLFEGGAFNDFLRRRGSLLPPDEMMLAQQWLLVDRSVYEVRSVRPGVSMEWRDVRTGDVHEIRERTASRQVKPGELYCARVVPAGETTQIFGGLEPVSMGERDHLIALLDSDPYPLELVAFLSRRFAPPVVLNSEGEPIIFCVALLRVSDPATLPEALDAEYDREPEAPAEMPVWFEHILTNGMQRIRAELDLRDDVLRIHTNSEARLERVFANILRLDPAATTLTETREPADFQTTEQAVTSGVASSVSPFGLPEDPAIVSALEEMILQYEESWLNEHIPALGGHTARECAEDPTRRPDLITLLDSFPQDNLPGQMSVARLRSALELD